MSTSKKRPEPKTRTVAEPIPGFEADENYVAQYRAVEVPVDSPEIPEAPLAAPDPSPMDRLAAVELANIELDARVRQLERNCMKSHGMR